MSYKVLIIGDTHFGCRSNSDNYLNFMIHYFKNDIVHIIDKHQIFDVRILGDLFDNRHSVNIKVLNTVIDLFDFFEKRFPNTIFTILLGNHDIYLPDSLEYHSLKIFNNFKNIRIVNNVTIDQIHNKRLVTIPWLVENTKAFNDFYSLLYSGEQFDFLFGHLEIKGFEMINDVYCQDGLEKEKLENIFRYIFSGHFHKRHCHKSIFYVGTPYEITWNDFNNQKGVHILDIDTETIEFIPNHSSPKHKKIFVSEIKQKPIKKEDVVNNVIKVIIDKKIPEESIAKLITKLEEYKPFKIETEITYIEKISNEEIHQIIDSKKDDLVSLYIEFLNSDKDILEEKKELAKKMFIEEYLNIINSNIK